MPIGVFDAKINSLSCNSALSCSPAQLAHQAWLWYSELNEGYLSSPIENWETVIVRCHIRI